MTDQLSSLYVATLFLALIGLIVCINALLASGLRWLGRRIASRRHGKDERHGRRTSSGVRPFPPLDSATARTSADRPGADQRHRRLVPH